MKKYLFLFLVFNQLTVFAFDYKVSLRDKVFNKAEFKFSILKFIDGRLNKQKPIGIVPSAFSQQPHTVGNDSLDFELNKFFAKSQSFVDTANKIIVALNQLNTRFIRGTNDMGGKKEELEMRFSLDYYKVSGNTCSFIYQQYYIHRENVTFSGPTKGINNAFSQGLKASFQEFENQLKSNKTISSAGLDTNAVYSFLYSKPEQIVNHQNVKDGFYFSCKDLYLNKPSLAEVTFPDTALMAKEVILLKSIDYINMDRAYAIVRFNRIFIYTTYHRYKEALFNEDGKLYFPDVTRSSISGSAAAGSLAVGLARVFLPIGFIGGFTSSLAQDGIKKSGTTKTTSDVIIDLETGDLVYKTP